MQKEYVRNDRIFRPIVNLVVGDLVAILDDEGRIEVEGEVVEIFILNKNLLVNVKIAHNAIVPRHLEELAIFHKAI